MTEMRAAMKDMFLWLGTEKKSDANLPLQTLQLVAKEKERRWEQEFVAFVDACLAAKLVRTNCFVCF